MHVYIIFYGNTPLSVYRDDARDKAVLQDRLKTLKKLGYVVHARKASVGPPIDEASLETKAVIL